MASGTDLDLGAPGAALAAVLDETLREELAPDVSFAVQPHEDDRGFTLACTTGVHLTDVENRAASASLLLELSASMEDSGLRIGVEGELDEVHLYRFVLSEGLEAADLVAIARSMSLAAGGVGDLLRRETSETATAGE